MRRKIVSFIVVLALFASMLCSAYAVEERGSTFVWGELYLYAAPNHAYIAFHNASPSVIYIGNYSVECGETITLGTFSDAPNYIYINRELMNIGQYQGAKAVKMDIFIEDFDYAVSAIISVIDSQRIYDASNNNCTHFAMGIWNAVAPSNADISFSFNPHQNATTNFNNFGNGLSSNLYYLERTIYPSEQSVSYQTTISLT